MTSPPPGRLDFPAAYDELNAADDDYRFYAALAEELGARRIVDLGCGTGTLACLLAAAGCSVVGIDPDERMLGVARSKPGAAAVDWRVGDSSAADSGWAELAVMSGHVAQLFVLDDEWAAVLGDLRRALRPGGTLAFESRNPAARGWERWTRERTLRTVTDRDGTVEFWHRTVQVELPRVTYATYTRDPATGVEESDTETLAFRELPALASSLDEAGFTVERVYGDWLRGPVSDASPELVVVATRR